MALAPAAFGHRRVVLVAMALGAIAVTGAACGSGGSSPGRGTAAAPHAVPYPLRSAIVAMEHAPNFSFTATVSRNGGTNRLTGEFVAPDVEQLTLTTSNGTQTPVLFVGSKAFVRSAGGQWVDAIGNPSRPTDPRATFASLLGARFDDGHNGTFGCVLDSNASAALEPGPSTGPLRCSVTVQGPVVSNVRLESASFRAAIAYSAVGTSPPIAHP